MARVKLFLAALLTASCFFFLSTLVAAQDSLSESAKEFYERQMKEADALIDEAERQVRPGDTARKYRELVDRAVEWEKEGIDRYGYDDPALPRLGGDAYYKSTAMREYARYLTQDYRARIEQTEDPYQKFSLLQEWTNKGYDYFGESFNGTWDERVVDYRDMSDALSRAYGDETRGFRLSEDAEYIIERRPGVARRILDAIDEKIRQESDPFWRAELLRDRLEKTNWVLRTAWSGIFDERVIPPLGRNGLGESKILKEQGGAIIDTVKKLIDQESDIENKKELAEKLLDIVKWLKKEWDKADYDDYYQPDMGDWPDSLDDLIDTSSLPAPLPTPLPKVTTPKPAAPTISQCDFKGYLSCLDQFDVQGCIYACPMVSKPCPDGTSPRTECKVTDEACSNTCWDKGNVVGSQCAIQNRCSMQEIGERLRAQ